MKAFFRKSGHWIWIFILTDVIFLFATWVIRPDSIIYMLPFLSLFSLIAVSIGVASDKREREKDSEEISAFLDQPDEKSAERLYAYFDRDPAAQNLVTEYMRTRSLVKETRLQMSDYQEYIEAWVHEVKTPISLMELMLENHKDEMSLYVCQRLHYAVHQMMEDTERILYYSRLNAEHPDFHLEHFSLSDCVREKLDEYEMFLPEKGIRLKLDLVPADIISDRRIVSFMFSQLMSNAVKYADSRNGAIYISTKQEKDAVSLRVFNNGTGVPPEDRAFLFDKGFTGSHPDRQKATGMGLYLVKKYAEKLGISVQIEEQIPFPSGFGIQLIFHL